MNKILSLLSIMLVAVAMLPSCSKEDIWSYDDDSNKPHRDVSFKKVKEASEVNNIENIVRSSSTDDIDTGTFVVEVSREDRTYYYGTLAEMPEIISLPVATGYKVTVHSPENPAAAWDSPYYEGTQQFDVDENDVTYVEPVVCKLANVKVSIVFDSSLLPLMEDDCSVKVETGNGASLTFSKSETRSGFFRFEQVDGQATLVATFCGTVDENFEENFRTYTSVAPGNHYIITYTLHGVEPDVPDVNGTVTLGLVVDSNVSSDNLTINVNHEDELLPDTDRPTQGSEDPEPPTPPTPPTLDENAPSVELSGDLGSDWTQSHIVPLGETRTVKVTVHSDSPEGITVFTVDIDSETLTESILSGVGLAKHLDLVNPGSLATGLQSLGFPINVGGMQDPDVMDITNFTQFLGVYGAATHKFIITVGDANGTTTKTLTLISQ